jgi:hypothetical protein
VAYISTCADTRPVDGAVFLILDLATGKYRELIDTQHYYGFIVVDYLGRAYHPMLGGDIIRYDPRSDKLERLKQTIDGQSPTPESRLALDKPDPINWDITPDGKTLYAIAMSGNALFSYDLTAEGGTLPGKHLGKLVPGAKSTDCRAMCVGPTGTMWASVTESVSGWGHLNHLVSYRAGDKAPVDHGPVSVANPEFTEFKGPDGKPLPFHGGFGQFEGVTTTKYVTMGVCESRDGQHVYMMVMHPYTLLQVRKPANR